MNDKKTESTKDTSKKMSRESLKESSLLQLRNAASIAYSESEQELRMKKQKPAGIDPIQLTKGMKVIEAYTELGIYNFADIIKDFYFKEGEEVRDIYDAIKQCYAAYRENAPDNVYNQMDSNTRKLKLETILEEIFQDESPKKTSPLTNSRRELTASYLAEAMIKSNPYHKIPRSKKDREEELARMR